MPRRERLPRLTNYLGVLALAIPPPLLSSRTATQTDSYLERTLVAEIMMDSFVFQPVGGAFSEIPSGRAGAISSPFEKGCHTRGTVSLSRD